MSTLTQWIAADGSTIALDGTAGVTVRRGVAGLDCPPIVNTLDQRVNFGGAVRVNSRQPEHPVMLPLLLDLNVISMSTIVRAFQGPGTLVASSGRELREVIYEGGLGAPRTVDNGGVEGQTFRKVDIDLVALDPWWYGPLEAVQQVFGSPTGWDDAISWDAAIPWDGGSSATIVVVGDAPAFPQILVAGTATTITIGVAGLYWSLDVALGAGEFVTVDSNPGRRGPHRGTSGIVPSIPDYATDWSLLTESSRLFVLPVGSTPITFGVTGAAGGAAFVMLWEPRWLTP